jgi:hypothetical protein
MAEGVRMLGLVSKSEYARLRGRAPSAVSNWIAEGKLKPPALVGSGPRAKVDVAQADRQLGALLDLGQQLAQERPVASAASGDDGDASPTPGPLVDDDNRRRLKARRCPRPCSTWPA